MKLTKTELRQLIKESINEIFDDGIQTAPEKSLKEQLKEYITNKYKGLVDEGLDDSFEIALYWVAHDWYVGQWSPLYFILSTSPYKPSRLARGVESEDDELIKDMYNDIVEYLKTNTSELK